MKLRRFQGWLAAALACSPLAPAFASIVSHGPHERFEDFARYQRIGQVSRFEAFFNTLSRNQTCQENGLSKVTFRNILAVLPNQDYCEIPDADLPPPVANLLARMGAVHRQIAEVLGQSFEQTVGLGIQVEFRDDPSGVMGSYASGQGLTMTAFPDWSLNDFSSMVYAHELIHVLTFNRSALSQALTGLLEHPYLVEAFPDLVAATVHDTAILTVEDDGLAQCLKDFRDQRPTKSLAMRFGHFYNFASLDTMHACCSSVPLADRSARTKKVCSGVIPSSKDFFYAEMERNGMAFKRPTDADLEAPFEAKNCEVNLRGYDTMEGCDTHQYGHPLTSFFFALKEKLGRQVLTEFMSVLRSQASNVSRYSCEYTYAAPNAASQVQMRTRGLVQAFVDLRESLDAQGQAAFDQVWQAHEMGRLFEIDAIYLQKAVRFEGLKTLASENMIYAMDHGCASMAGIARSECHVTCTKL